MSNLLSKVYTILSVSGLISIGLTSSALSEGLDANEKPLVRDAITAQAAAPIPLVWSIDPTCTKLDPADSTRRCAFTHTQKVIGGSNDPYDHFHFEMDAPGPVYRVKCELHSHELSEDGYKSGVSDGTYRDNTGICEGYINGGDDPIRMTVWYRAQ